VKSSVIYGASYLKGKKTMDDKLPMWLQVELKKIGVRPVKKKEPPVKREPWLTVQEVQSAWVPAYPGQEPPF